MGTELRSFRCGNCKELFEGKTKRAHDSTPCPFCGQEAVELLDTIDLACIQNTITGALELRKKTQIDNLSRYLEYALEAGVSKHIEIKAFLERVNEIDAALLFTKHLR